MSGEPDDGGEGRPKILNKATGWVGGLTALVVALAGLRAAYNELKPPPAPQTTGVQSQETDPGNVPTSGAETNAAGATTTDPEAAPKLATSYKGKDVDAGKDVSMDWIDRQWVVTDRDGTYKYDQQGDRSDGMTYARTPEGKYELRWKNDGGVVELSDDDQHTYWRPYYTVKVSNPDAT